MRTVSINKKTYNCYTLTELASLCGKSRSALEAMERKGVLPRANLKLPYKNNFDNAPIRLYTEDLANEIVPIISKFRAFVKVTDYEKQQISNAFFKEIKRLKSEKDA